MLKKLVSITLLCCIAFSSISFAADYKTEFAWAKDAVDFCVENDILQGDGEGDLMLGDNLTQAQCAALLVRTFGVNKVDSSLNIPGSHWGRDEMRSISGYILRKADFSPDAYTTREEFISLYVQSIGLKPENKVSVLKENFRDYSSSYPEYLPYLAAAFNAKLVQGSENKIFPKDKLMRAEAITLIYRAVQNGIGSFKAKKTDLLGPPQVTLTQAVKWAKSKGAHQRFIDAASVYWKYGDLTGIRPEALYAQAAKETGYGNYGGRVLPEMNNWAGIKKYGATGDETEDHETFATADDGVRAHFNHMIAYTGGTPIGEPHGRYKSACSTAWAGTVKYIEELGGKWCPDVNYGKQIVEMIKEMIK